MAHSQTGDSHFPSDARTTPQGDWGSVSGERSGSWEHGVRGPRSPPEPWCPRDGPRWRPGQLMCVGSGCSLAAAPPGSRAAGRRERAFLAQGGRKVGRCCQARDTARRVTEQLTQGSRDYVVCDSREGDVL